MDDKNILDNLGIIIKRGIRRSGKTHQEIADDMGTSKSMVSHWIAGRSEIRILSLLKLMTIIDIEADLVALFFPDYRKLPVPRNRPFTDEELAEFVKIYAGEDNYFIAVAMSRILQELGDIKTDRRKHPQHDN